MLNTNRSEHVLDGEVLTAAEPRCVDLVPVTPTTWVSKPSLTRPDPTFVAHLIATAAQAPQTCKLRRATPADAKSAYGPGPQERRGVARRTRRVI